MRAGHRPTRSAASLRALAPCQIPALSALSPLRPSPNHLQSPRDAGKRTSRQHPESRSRSTGRQATSSQSWTSRSARLRAAFPAVRPGVWMTRGRPGTSRTSSSAKPDVGTGASQIPPGQSKRSESSAAHKPGRVDTSRVSGGSQGRQPTARGCCGRCSQLRCGRRCHHVIWPGRRAAVTTQRYRCWPGWAARREVAGLQLGEITISGKPNRHDRLPAG